MMDIPEPEKDSCTKGLTTRLIGTVINFHDQLGSTNEMATELAKGGAKEGTVVVARTQTKGKGRNDKEFSSPRGGIYLSVILKPDMPPDKIYTLPLVMGLSVSKAIQCSTSKVATVKWPNDVILEERKVAGILMVPSIKGMQLEFVIVGIGINLNTESENFSEEAGKVAGSIREITGKIIDPNEFLRDLMYFLDLNYSQFLNGQSEDLLDQWAKRSDTIGSEVKVTAGSREIRGKALGLDQTGALIVQTRGGMKRVTSGECTSLSQD